MHVQFIPVPPDTVISLRQDLSGLDGWTELEPYFDKCVAWASVLEAGLPDNEVARAFLKEARRICHVRKTERRR